ncbi:22130_t:CDS:1 [Cetraspora pellucida]|uniref:22130_t:CDS:1 n=1 Tax=Cetraspora pellucida TaxID=1433469 RepID=A0A9N9CK80_9GLOM|nr:22130_t:CDS:1 [Cetraspora pellucida]
MTSSFSNTIFKPRRHASIFFLFIILLTTFYFIGHEQPLNKFNNSSDCQEKYLTYLPHDGFNNQRIELENAIFLAWFLNRTLIIPPILFFNGVAPIISQPYDELYNLLTQFMQPNNDFKKNNFTFCFSEYKKDCNFVLCFREDQNNCKTVSYTMYNWEELMDFTFLKQHINYIHRQDFSLKHLLESLQIHDDNEVYNVTSDQTQYQQRYYDNPKSTTALGKFKESVNLIDLSKRSEKLLHFGSVFSSIRIVIQLPESKKFWRDLKNKMLPNNPIIINIVNNIVDKIGGPDSFVGVHARLGDGYFVENQNKTVQELIRKIQHDFKNYDVTNHESCLPTIIFLATDVKRDHLSLQPFFKTFPCVFTIDDFNDLLKPLKLLKNPRDGMIMYEFFLPLVDLLVVSKGNKFYQTHKSTFSKYAEQLNNIRQL